MAKDVTVKSASTGLMIGGEVDFDELLKEATPISGAGTSQAREDNIIPFLIHLQDGSPQVKKREAKYIDGAEPGMIMRSDINSLFKGDEGVIFQPCYFNKRWVEWVPRETGGGGGAGFVASYDERPANARQASDNKNKWVLPNGNHIVETRYHYGNLLDPVVGRADQVVIGMSSSEHTVSRSWMALMNQFRIGGSVIAPSFFRAYRLKTAIKSNKHGSWFIWKPEDLGWVNKPLRDMGHQLYEAVASGEKVADMSADDTAGANHIDDDVI